MKTPLLVSIAVLTGVAAVGVFALKLSLPLIATIAIAGTCLAWLVAIVVLPWNLYFQARHLLFEIERSRRKGIAVEDEQARIATQVERRMLGMSIGLHLASAMALALAAWLCAEPLGFAFAGLFLLSTLFRPGVEYYRYLRARLSDALSEVKYPRDDIRKVVGELGAATAAVEDHRQQLGLLHHQLSELGQKVTVGDRENQRHLEQVARTFEETIDRLTDSQEIISGLKAFLRLVQAPRPGGQPT